MMLKAPITAKGPSLNITCSSAPSLCVYNLFTAQFSFTLKAWSYSYPPQQKLIQRLIIIAVPGPLQDSTVSLINTVKTAVKTRLRNPSIIWKDADPCLFLILDPLICPLVGFKLKRPTSEILHAFVHRSGKPLFLHIDSATRRFYFNCPYANSKKRLAVIKLSLPVVDCPHLDEFNNRPS